MRHVRQLASGLAALFLVACSNYGDISGNVHVSAGHSGMGVYTALWQVPAVFSDPTKPDSMLTPTGGTPVFLGIHSWGVTDNNEGTFKYTLVSLPLGLYIVGAFLDNNGGANFATDLSFIDQDHPVQVNPAVAALKTAKKDLFLGESDPALGTISGTVHVSNAAAAFPIYVVLASGDPFTTSSTLLAQQAVPGGGNDLPYQLFNTPLTQVWVIAFADANMNGALDLNEDMVAMAIGNPWTVDSTTHTASKVDLWLDAQSPSLGSIQGTLTLNGELAKVSVSVLAFSSNFEHNAAAEVIAVSNVTGTMTSSIPFTIPSLPVGPIYLYAIVQTDGVVVAKVVGQTPYTGGSPTNAAPVNLTSAMPNAMGVMFPLGVGRVSGTIQFNNAPASVTGAWVAATQMAAGTTYFRQYSQVNVAPGNSTLSYEVFGLLDGTYAVSLIPDLAGNGSIVDTTNMQGEVSGSNPSVTVTMGSSEASNFTYTFR